MYTSIQDLNIDRVYVHSLTLMCVRYLHHTACYFSCLAFFWCFMVTH